jgi:hypothetical protein
LVCCDRAISQLSNKGMYTDLPPIRLILIPMVIMIPENKTDKTARIS